MRTTVMLDKGLWKEFKILAIKEGKSVTKLLNELLREKVDEGMEMY